MNSASLAPFLQEMQLYVYAAAFGLARITGVLLISPVFTRLGMQGMLRNSVGLGLCIPVIPMIMEIQHGVLPSAGEAAILLFKETAVGMLIGLVAGVPFWAAELAGALADTQRGASMSMFSDASQEEANITGTIMTLAMLAVFISSGGMRITIGIFYDSYGIWPIDHLMPIFGPDAGSRILSLLDNVFAMGLLLAMPIVIGLFLSDVLLGLLSRAAPQLHIFDLSLNLKSLIFALIMALYSGYMLKYMEYDMRYVLDSKNRLETLRGPADR